MGMAVGLPPLRSFGSEPAPAHAISMYGDLKYPPGFAHFDWVNPDAPKGGTFVQSATGSFDSFNPFILRGEPAGGVGLVFETLTVQSLDEPFSEYGLLAGTIAVPEDRSWVQYELRPEARWHDGKPVTPADVVWSFETLVAKGHPRYRAYYANVASVEAVGERGVRFTFDTTGVNRELPLITGQLAVLPRHWYEERDFATPDLVPPVGSGPYRIASFDAGRSVELERVKAWWGADLPVNRGRYNYDTIRVEYYRDLDVSLEAFKAGRFDIRFENSAKRWATGYTGPAVEQGLIRTEKLPIPPPARMQGYIFNLRRPIFQDRRVRQAIGLAFDFEWSNKALMYGQYERIRSYFHGEPPLMARGLPEGAELALLEPFREQLPPELFTDIYEPPKTDGSGNNRENLRHALRLLREAGWQVEDGVLTETATGRKMQFELLMSSPADERLALPFAQNLERLGIKVQPRTVDPASYQNRMDSFDFDVTTDLWGQSGSPGNEQRSFWGSEAASVPGSQNTMGIADPVIDALIENVIRAPDRPALEAACRALDRVLLWGFYLVPHFTTDGYRIAYWDKFGWPEIMPTEAPDLFAWWIDPEKAQRVAARKPDVATAPD